MRVLLSFIRAKKLVRLSGSGLVTLLAMSLIAASFQTKSAASSTAPDASNSSETAGAQMEGGVDSVNNSYTFTSPVAMVLQDRPTGSPTSGPANPFPSDINVAGVPGTVGKVTVTLTGFTHTWPDDIDILLVAPGGRTVFLMSDACGDTQVNNLNLTFDDDAPAVIPDAAGVVSGSYKTADYPEERPASGTDIFPGPAPSGPYGATLSTLGGINPNGVWSLYVGDDEGGLVGNITGGWSLTITNAITAQNTNAITLPDSGAASLYPSTTNVSGLVGAVTNVTVYLNNFSHTAPDDVDLLLVAPNGRSVVVMSDVGGTTAVNNLSLTLDDSATIFLPDGGALASGVFKPTDFEPGDSFPAPAPSGPPTGATLASLNGINPNGAWKLYAVDDTGGNAGSISGGWSLGILTTHTACVLSVAPLSQAFPITGGTGSIEVNSPFNCDWTATTSSSFITINSGSSGTGGVSGAIGFTVAPNMGGGRTGTILVTTAGGFSRTFTIQQPSGCPFSLNQETQNFGGGGGQGSVTVTAAGACGWSATTKDTWITIQSGAGNGNGTVTFTVAANNTGAQRSGTVMIGARTLTIVQGSQNVRTVFDFDGDGKSDYAVTRTSGGVNNWYLLQSANGPAGQQWGASGTVSVPADYDGDNKWDIAVWQTGTPSVFYILRSQTGTLQAVQWGTATDDPRITQDFDGDGKADPAVTRYDNTTGLNWYIRESLTGNLRAVQFGALTDVPVRGDFDGDGKADIAVYRRSNGTPANTFYVLGSSDGAVRAATFGNYATDYLVPADFDGDGKTDYAVWRGRVGGDGNWYWLQSSDGAFRAFQFGIAGSDLPAPADYDGDGKTDIAVWRSNASATFYVNRSAAGFIATPWGTTGDSVPAFSLQAR